MENIDIIPCINEKVAEGQLEQIKEILQDFTEYVESHSDNTTNYLMADDVFEYIDEMWKVFGVDSKKNRIEVI